MVFKFLFLFSKLGKVNSDFSFSSRNGRNCFQISLSLLELTFLTLVNHWWGAPRTFSMLYHQASHLISLLPITIHMIMMSSLILMVCMRLCFQNKCRQRSISLKEEETQGEDYPYQADKGQAPLVCA